MESDVQRNFPVYNRRIMVKGRTSRIKMVLTGDWHYGAAACDSKSLITEMKRLGGQSDTYWFGMGDLADAIGFTDKRFDPRSLDPVIWNKVGRNIGNYQDEVRRGLKRIVRPAAHNCLGLIEGNHESSGLRMSNPISILQPLIDDYRDWCAERDTPVTPNPYFEQFGDCAAVVLDFVGGRRRSRLVLFLAHGAGFATTVGGRVNKLESVMAWLPDADVYACGHFHDRLTRPRPTLRIAHSPIAPRVVPVDKMFILVPSFMATYHGEGNYASRRLYPPSVLGWVELDIEPFGDRRYFGGDREFTRPKVTSAVTI